MLRCPSFAAECAARSRFRLARSSRDPHPGTLTRRGALSDPSGPYPPTPLGPSYPHPEQNNSGHWRAVTVTLLVRRTETLPPPLRSVRFPTAGAGFCSVGGTQTVPSEPC